MDRLAASPGIDHSRDAEIVAIFTRQIYELEAQLPLAIDRDEPLWEIDEALNPDAVARTRDQLSAAMRSEEHTSELQSLMRISYAVFCLKKKKKSTITYTQAQI